MSGKTNVALAIAGYALMAAFVATSVWGGIDHALHPDRPVETTHCNLRYTGEYSGEPLRGQTVRPGRMLDVLLVVSGDQHESLCHTSFEWLDEDLWRIVRTADEPDVAAKPACLKDINGRFQFPSDPTYAYVHVYARNEQEGRAACEGSMQYLPDLRHQYCLVTKAEILKHDDDECN